MGNSKLSREELIEDRNKRALRTYLFRYYDLNSGFPLYRPHYPWFAKERDTDEVPQRGKDFFEIQLYATQRETGNQKNRRSHYLTLLDEYFDAPFGDARHTGKHWVFLPKQIYDDFLKVINRFNLIEYSDFLLECVCIAQEVLDETVSSWEMPHYQDLKKSAAKEWDILTKINKKYQASQQPGKISQTTPLPTLESILFKYSDGSDKISHPFLMNEILEGVQKIMTDWSTADKLNERTTFVKSFDGYPYKHDFKYSIAKAFYNFLTEKNFFHVSKKARTPNDLILCIVNLLEFCLIPISPTDQSEAEKIKIVRNWLKRH